MCQLCYRLHNTPIAHPLHAKPKLLYLVAFWHAQRRYVYLVQAVGVSAGSAAEVNVVMLVPVFVAGLLAEGIACNAISAGDAVQQTMLLKGMQGAVQRDPVKLLAELLFYGSVRQGMAVLKK